MNAQSTAQCELQCRQLAGSWVAEAVYVCVHECRLRGAGSQPRQAHSSVFLNGGWYEAQAADPAGDYPVPPSASAPGKCMPNFASFMTVVCACVCGLRQ